MRVLTTGSRELSLGADLCIVFWNGKSNGTKHAMDLAKKAGIPVEEISL